MHAEYSCGGSFLRVSDVPWCVCQSVEHTSVTPVTLVHCVYASGTRPKKFAGHGENRQKNVSDVADNLLISSRPRVMVTSFLG